MRTVLNLLLWPVAATCRLGLDALIWLRPSIAAGRRPFPEPVRRLLGAATAVEVHYAALGPDEPPATERIGPPAGFTSLGGVRLSSDRARRRVLRSVLRANRECLGGFLCLDAEYGLRVESEAGRAELAICFRCMQVWVAAEVEGGGRFYPISWRPQPLLDRLLRSAGVPKPLHRQEGAAEPGGPPDRGGGK